MAIPEVDLLIIGAGPVGLTCALLAHKVGLSCTIVDKSEGPLKLGRADAMNARTLQLLQLLGDNFFEELHVKGLHCNTSSTWKNGQLTSRQNTWWKSLRGSEHKHFLMLGQPYLEEILDRNLTAIGKPVERNVTVISVGFDGTSTASPTWARICSESGTERFVRAKYLIGADGAHSLVRKTFPDHFIFDPLGNETEMTWAVLDGEVETTFPREAEIINFQVDTSDVARIPRERNIDRYYVRMDHKIFEVEEAVEKIRRAVAPHPFKFVDLEWNSQFTVRERLASRFSIDQRVFLAGDACHVHSVNGGQGLNTGLSDAFNLIWKINLHAKRVGSESVLKSYERERRPVAKTVIETAGALVRATKYSQVRQLALGANGSAPSNEDQWDHSSYYVGLVKRNSRFITGMGISYVNEAEATASGIFISPEYGVPLVGYRGFDFHMTPLGSPAITNKPTRLYTELAYDGHFDLLLFLPSFETHPAQYIASLDKALSEPLKALVRIRIIYPSLPSIIQPPAIASESVTYYADTPIFGSEIGAVSGRALYAHALGVEEEAEEKELIVVVLRPDSYVGYAEAVGTEAVSFEGVSVYFAGL